jgi:NADPH2:quinone reductase
LAAVDEKWLYPTPDGVTDREAASAALVSITAHLGLVSHAAIQPGETIFVSGGSGGVGSAVVQIAKALGGRVLATAGTPEKRQRVHEFGADMVLDYRREDLVAAVLAAVPGGVDVHWETRREPDFETAIAMLAERGRMVLMAGREARSPLPVGPFYVKGCRLLGFVMFKASPQEQAAAATDINRWLARGRLRAPVDRVVTLAHVAEAHALQEAATVGGSGELAGKIVVEP